MVLTEGLALRIDRVAVEWSRAWMAGVSGIHLAPDAPDHVLAPCHPDRPDLDFQNRVNGLTPDDAGAVPALLAFYEGHGVRPWFELVPSDRSGPLLQAIGAEPVGFHAVAFGPLPSRPLRTSPAPAVAKPEMDGMEVEVVDPTDDQAFRTYARTRMEAHELPPEVVEQGAADLGGWRTAPRTTLYLARVDGLPAATAALTTSADGAIAYLADGATLPACRGRGLQTQLIRRRLHDAAEAGAELAAGQASFGSTSHRNLQGEGLSSGFTKLVLRRGTEPGPHH